MKLMNKIVSVVASAALAAMLLAGCGASASSAAASSEATSSSEVAASSEDASSTAEDAAGDSAAKVHATFTVTDGEKLSDALVAAGVISQDEADAGFVTTVNGEKADYDADGAWWCLTDGSGEMTSVGVADIELHDGDSYAFTYTK